MTAIYTFWMAVLNTIMYVLFFYINWNHSSFSVILGFKKLQQRFKKLSQKSLCVCQCHSWLFSTICHFFLLNMVFVFFLYDILNHSNHFCFKLNNICIHLHQSIFLIVSIFYLWQKVSAIYWNLRLSHTVWV